MSTGEIITVEKDRVVLALRNFYLGLQRREEMYRAMGAAMLVSIRRTFREQGSPANSWVPLAASTIKRDPKKYGSGHKLLIDKGILLNSITFAVFSLGVMVGTNLKYARVHQEGSRDRTGGPFGPQAKLADRSVKVKAHFRTIHLAPRYERREVTRADGSKVMVPFKVYHETVEITNKRGQKRMVTRLLENDDTAKSFGVRSHTKHQNIPARPYMVFRPEDPGRLRSVAVQFVNKAKADAGLAGA